MPLTELPSQSFTDGKVRPDVEWLPIINDALSLGPGRKSGGEGKVDGDGAVDIDDLACEVTRERLSSELEYELGE